MYDEISHFCNEHIEFSNFQIFPNDVRGFWSLFYDKLVSKQLEIYFVWIFLAIRINVVKIICTSLDGFPPSFSIAVYRPVE